MIGLLRAELRRCWSRRSVHLFGLLALAGIILAAVLVFINTVQPTLVCTATSTGKHCIKQTFDLVDLNEVFQGISAPITILGIALAASFMGAEWGAGTMTTLLTWEPRRGRVYAAKLIAAAIFTFISAVILQIVLGLALIPSVLAHGSTAGANGHWYLIALGSVTRGAIVATIGAGIGVAAGALARNTTAAVIVSFVWLFVAENLIQGLKPLWSGWLFTVNAGLFIAGPKSLQGSPNIVVGHTQFQAFLVDLAYAVVVSAVTIWFFLRRDVT
jgi:ABC-type transport system involved in multi-copper enzyme maturation permease subunit